MRKIFFILLAWIPLVCVGQGKGPTHSDSLLLEFKKSQFEVYRDFEKVPKSFFRFMNRNGWQLSMVDYGKEYNKTDIQSNHLPNSVLIELGVSEKNLYVLLFDHGGYSVARRAFIFRQVKKTFVVKELLLRPEIDSIESLKRYYETAAR